MSDFIVATGFVLAAVGAAIALTKEWIEHKVQGGNGAAFLSVVFGALGTAIGAAGLGIYLTESPLKYVPAIVLAITYVFAIAVYFRKTRGRRPRRPQA